MKKEVKVVGFNVYKENTKDFGIPIKREDNKNKKSEICITFYYRDNGKKFSSSFMVEKGNYGCPCFVYKYLYHKIKELKRFPKINYKPIGGSFTVVDKGGSCWSGKKKTESNPLIQENEFFKIVSDWDDYYPEASVRIKPNKWSKR